MNQILVYGRAATTVAAAILIFQPLASTMAAPPVAAQAAPQPKIEAMRTVDVQLDDKRGLTGQVVDVQGRPVPNAAVTVSNSKRQWHAVTDKQGKYRVASLQGGSYLVRVGDQLKQTRAWAPGTAPPHANKGLMMVHGNHLIRGQAYCGTPVGGHGVGDVVSHPLFIGGVIAAAIAIPIAIHNSDDDDPPAS